jgi:predicted nucleic acid-binding protein
MGRLVAVRIYLDSNVFIRILEPRQGDTIAVDLLTVLVEARRAELAILYTSQLTLSEVLVHPIRENDLEQQQEYVQLLQSGKSWIETIPIAPAILIDAARIRASSRLKLPDAIHAATATAAKSQILLTADADFNGFNGLNSIALVKPDEVGILTLTEMLRG